MKIFCCPLSSKEKKDKKLPAVQWLVSPQQVLLIATWGAYLAERQVVGVAESATSSVKFDHVPHGVGSSSAHCTPFVRQVSRHRQHLARVGPLHLRQEEGRDDGKLRETWVDRTFIIYPCSVSVKRGKYNTKRQVYACSTCITR